MYLIRLFVIIIIFFITLYNGTVSVLIPFGLFYTLIHVIKCKSWIREIWINSFVFYSFVGVINYSIYLSECGLTRAPYGDDSYYYDYALDIINGVSIFTRFEPYSYFLATFMLPIHRIFKYVISHYELLPINWFVGSTTVALVLYFTDLVVPIKSKKHQNIAVCLLLFNSCFIDGVVHLYRDGLICLLIMICCIHIYNSSYNRSILISLFLGLLRGANGFIMLFFIVLNYVQRIFRFSKKSLVLSFVLILAVFYISYNNLGIERYARSFSNTTGESMSISERISQFTAQEEAQGGVIRLLKSRNPVYQLVAIPIYMLSPFKAGSFEITHFYSLRTTGWYVTRFRIETVWEFLNIIFYLPFYLPLFLGVYYWSKETKINNIILLFIFIITLLLVTLVSMQSRHKMAFIVFFPIIYSYYCNKTTQHSRSLVKKINIIISLLVILYNIIL